MQAHRPITLISLISEQIWPQVQAVKQANPCRVILVHTSDSSRSKRPAIRLKEFFSQVPELGLEPEVIHLEEISGDDFNLIDKYLTEILKKYEITPQESILCFTGGNKLMAAAAFRWAMDRQIPAFYQEREGTICHFKPDGRNIETTKTPANIRCLDNIDPLLLVQCQIDSATIKSEGELLTLNDSGFKTHENQIVKTLQDETKLTKGAADFKKWLSIQGDIDHSENEGSNFEYGTALVILKCGVKCVRHGVRFKPEKASRIDTEESELDIIFNWKGQLWLVDCKDKTSGQNKIEALITKLSARGPLSDEALIIIENLKKELLVKDIHQLRQDLQSAAEIGGLRCRAVAMRRGELPIQAKDYVRSRQQIEIVTKKEALPKWKKLLSV